MWAGMLSTLLIGTDIVRGDFNRSDAFTILSNKDVIGTFSQDALAAPVRRVRNPSIDPPNDAPTAQLWFKPLKEGGRGVILFNRGETALRNWTFALSDVDLTRAATVYDCWQHTQNGTHAKSFSAIEVPAHGVAALRLEVT
jgi:alpha-galactosidase